MAGTSKGARSVDLYIPFEAPSTGQLLERITFRPATFETLLRWESGEIAGERGAVIALMSELSGIPEQDILSVRFPDAEFLMGEFMAHLPQAIRENIQNGQIPVPQATGRAGFDFPDDNGSRVPERHQPVDPAEKVGLSTDPLVPHDHSGLEFPPDPDLGPGFEPAPLDGGDNGPESLPVLGPGFDISDEG